MLKYKPLPFSFLVLAILIVLHLVGSSFFWYWTYPWFDSVVHIISGVWVALVFLWLASYFGQINSMKEYKVKSLLIALISAVLFGIVWELVENLMHITFTAASGYGLDTAMDLLNDTIGGILAYLYFIKRRRGLKADSAILHPFYDQVCVSNKKA